MYDQQLQTLNPEIRKNNPNNTSSFKKQKDLPQKILEFVTAIIWVTLAGLCLYYTNFFYQIFHNPNIYEPFFTICITCYTVLIILALYISFVLPIIFKIQDIEEYNPRLISIGAIFGFIGVITLLISIWPIWGFTSFLIFITLWKGFFELSTLLPSGNLGGVLFVLINVMAVLSYKIIQHEGYLH